MRNPYADISDEELARIRRNAIDAAKKSILADVVTLYMKQLDRYLTVSLEGGGQKSILDAAHEAYRQLSWAFRPKLEEYLPPRSCG
jgi:hypothetical protein